MTYKRHIRHIAMLLALLAAGLCGCTAQPPVDLPAPSVPQPSAVATEAPVGEDYVLFINVGKADAALCALGGGYYLVDTGHKDSTDALLAALAAIGVDKLDGVFLTHPHSDHTGGFKALCKAYAVDTLYAPAISAHKKDGAHKLEAMAEKEGVPCKLLSAGDTVQAGDAHFAVLGPLERNTEDENDNSLVLRLCVGAYRVLFTGDMQFAEEATLLEAGTDLRADVLKVGNHGNPDATSTAFAQAVAPRYAIISTDRAADEDSANPRVLEALSGAEVFLTEGCVRGVLLRFGTAGITLTAD